MNQDIIEARLYMRKATDLLGKLHAMLANQDGQIEGLKRQIITDKHNPGAFSDLVRERDKEIALLAGQIDVFRKMGGRVASILSEVYQKLEANKYAWHTTEYRSVKALADAIAEVIGYCKVGGDLRAVDDGSDGWRRLFSAVQDTGGVYDIAILTEDGRTAARGMGTMSFGGWCRVVSS
jgi:hypothetical protein